MLFPKTAVFSRISARRLVKSLCLPSLLAVALLAVPMSSAYALGLDEAKARGLVGETASGYLASVNPSPSAEVRTLVEDINAKRRAEYERIAKQNGTSVASVEKLAAGKAFEKTPKGQYVRPEGGWVKK